MKTINFNSSSINQVFNQGVLKTIGIYKIFKYALEEISLDEMKKAVSQPIGKQFVLSFGEVKISDKVNGKKLCQNWLNDRFLEQVFIALTDSVVTANTLIDLLNTNDQKLNIEQLEKIERKYLSWSFEKLISKIEEVLARELEHRNEIFSIKDVRNFKQHRRGRVSKVDFSLKLVENRLFVHDGEKEHKLTDILGKKLEKGGKVVLKINTEEKEMAEGISISLEEQELADVLMTCFMFVTKLATAINEHVKIKLQ